MKESKPSICWLRVSSERENSSYNFNCEDNIFEIYFLFVVCCCWLVLRKGTEDLGGREKRETCRKRRFWSFSSNSGKEVSFPDFL